jgi:hypothetical protein
VKVDTETIETLPLFHHAYIINMAETRHLSRIAEEKAWTTVEQGNLGPMETFKLDKDSTK